MQETRNLFNQNSAMVQFGKKNVYYFPKAAQYMQSNLEIGKSVSMFTVSANIVELRNG